MTLPWYEWRNIRDRLFAFGSAVQGVSPYTMELEPDPAICPSGYTSFSKRLIMVNPTLFDVRPEDQYLLTKAVLCHEAAHRRFTTPTSLPSHIHMVSNLLEDERIEKLMEQEFAGVRHLLKRLSEQMLKDARPLEPESDDPAEVLSYILQSRFADRSGLPVRGELSAANKRLWIEVAPLVWGAWYSDSSVVCDANAEEILNILGIKEIDIPEWLKELLGHLEVVEGERKPGDAAEESAPSLGGPIRDAESDGEPFDGEPMPDASSIGKGKHVIEPKPYLDLLGKVRPLVSRLVEELSIEDSGRGPEPSERGGRLSVRQHVRDRQRPFLREEEGRPGVATITFRLIIDHSTSMNYLGRMGHAAQAAMLMHLAGKELSIPHEIVIAPNNIRLANQDSDEEGLAMIAGIVPAQTGWEDTGLAVSVHGGELASMTQDVKLLIVIHDGMGNDHELLARECSRLRDRVLIIGLGIGMRGPEAALLREQFGPDRYISCESSEELPEKVGAILRTLRGI